VRSSDRPPHNQSLQRTGQQSGVTTSGRIWHQPSEPQRTGQPVAQPLKLDPLGGTRDVSVSRTSGRLNCNGARVRVRRVALRSSHEIRSGILSVGCAGRHIPGRILRPWGVSVRTRRRANFDRDLATLHEFGLGAASLVGRMYLGDMDSVHAVHVAAARERTCAGIIACGLRCDSRLSTWSPVL
jgi:hypothetical protein